MGDGIAIHGETEDAPIWKLYDTSYHSLEKQTVAWDGMWEPRVRTESWSEECAVLAAIAPNRDL